MQPLKAVGGSPAKEGRHTAPSPTSHGESAGVLQSSASNGTCHVSRTKQRSRLLRDILLVLGGFGVLCALLAAAELVSRHADGPAICAVLLALVVVALMAAFRAEGRL